jgi:hypothetical protein
MGGECGTHEEKKNKYKVTVAKLQGKMSLGTLDVGERIVSKLILRNV